MSLNSLKHKQKRTEAMLWLWLWLYYTTQRTGTPLSLLATQRLSAWGKPERTRAVEPPPLPFHWQWFPLLTAARDGRDQGV